MRTYKSWDRFVIEGVAWFIIKRADPWAELQKDEMPKVGETMEIDGKEITAADVQIMSGSFGYRPEFLVKEATR
jgi:hypothetical protein